MKNLPLMHVTIAAMLFLFATGCQTVRSPEPVQVDRSSPQTLAACFYGALDARDFATMLECMEPSRQATYDKLLVEAQRFWLKASSLAQLIEDKYGVDAAEDFLVGVESPMEFLKWGIPGDDPIDWSRVPFEHSGDMAVASVGESVTFRTRKIDGKWYMSIGAINPNASGSSEMDPFEYFVWYIGLGGFRPACSSLDRYASLIRSGRMNKSRFYKELLEARPGIKARHAKAKKIPYGPPLEGLSIRLTDYCKIWKKNERLCFTIEIESESSTPLAFFLPGRVSKQGASLLGENTILEIDGKPISFPSVKVPELELIDRTGKGGFESIPIYLPEGLKLSPGEHTARFTVICKGGTATNFGETYKVLKGKLVSNTLTFIIEE